MKQAAWIKVTKVAKITATVAVILVSGSLKADDPDYGECEDICTERFGESLDNYSKDGDFDPKGKLKYGGLDDCMERNSEGEIIGVKSGNCTPSLKGYSSGFQDRIKRKAQNTAKLCSGVGHEVGKYATSNPDSTTLSEKEVQIRSAQECVHTNGGPNVSPEQKALAYNNCKSKESPQSFALCYAEQLELLAEVEFGGLIAPYCGAFMQLDSAHARTKWGAWLYTGAAATCAGACAATFGSAGLATGVGVACSAAGGTAATVDLVNTVQLNDEYQSWAHKAGTISGYAGAVGAGASTAALNGGLQKLATCAVAGLYTAMATTKHAYLKNYREPRREACNSIIGLMDNKEPKHTPNQGPGESGQPGSGSSLAGFGSGSSGSASSSRSGGLSDEDAQGMLDTINGNYGGGSSGGSAATAMDSIGGELMRQTIDPNKLNSDLAKMGLDWSKIGAALDGGYSPAQIAANASGMPADLANDFGEFSNAAIAKLQPLAGMGTGNSLAYSSGGGGKTAGSKSSSGGFSLLGGRKPAGNGMFGKGSGDLAFGGADKLGYDASDIWHANYRGSIFDLISHRVNASRDKVAKSRWATPYNRQQTGQD